MSHYKAMASAHGKGTCEECGGVQGWDCDCASAKTQELRDYFDSTTLVGTSGMEMDGGDFEDLITQYGADALHVWEGHGVFHYWKPGKRDMLAWEEDNTPVCQECHGEGTLTENNSFDHDPACDEDSKCPVCGGTGLRDDYNEN